MIELENQELFLCSDEQPAKLIFKVNMNKKKEVRLKKYTCLLFFITSLRRSCSRSSIPPSSFLTALGSSLQENYTLTRPNYLTAHQVQL